MKNNKRVVCLASIQYYLHTILLWPVYYGNWLCHLKNNKKKWCIWSLHLRNFLHLPVFALFLQKLRRLSRNSSNFIYIYLKLKLGIEKHICLKWMFLPQWISPELCSMRVPITPCERRCCRGSISLHWAPIQTGRRTHIWQIYLFVPYLQKKLYI